jgi:hypothetical protein
MTTLQMPTLDHERFDAICAPLEDFETLPTVVAKTPLEADEELEIGQTDAPLDRLIFAGLVAPY